MAKKKKTKIFNNKKVVYFFAFLVVFIVGASSFIAGYYVANTNTKEIVKKEKTKTNEALKELQKLVDENIKKQDEKKHIVKQKPKQEIKKETKLVNSEAIDYKENTHKEVKKEIKKVIYTTKPKLVIIMDDMSFSSQVKKLKNLGIKVTPSFFPPSKRHPNTAKYAKEFKHYMVHFPMQATNPNFREEPNTLHIDTDYQDITKVVKNIKKEFPKVKFVNNHTGSKFTENYYAMNKLYKILDKYNLTFVDSRTTSKTQAAKIAKKYNKVLLSRDVFLDNKADIKYIQNQLRQAIRIAKKRGYAIAICHPHKTTFLALKQSKYLLKNVEVIYIDELYKLYQNHKLSRL